MSQLELTLRERNSLLVAAGFAPAFRSHRSTPRRSARRDRRLIDLHLDHPRTEHR
jgi:hypothetical protein